MSIYDLYIFLEDTDAGGIVYHARYLHFLERARTVFFKSLGCDHASMIYDKTGNFVVTKMSLRYRLPAYLGDHLEVETKIIEVGFASVVLNQAIFKMNKGQRLSLFEATLTLAFINPKTNKVQKMPSTLHHILLNSTIRKENE